MQKDLTEVATLVTDERRVPSLMSSDLTWAPVLKARAVLAEAERLGK